MRKLALPTLVALALAAAAGAAATPKTPTPNVSTLIRAAARLTGLPAQRHVRVRVVPRADLLREATREVDRERPAAVQSYDTTLYRALGLLGPTEPLRPALVDAASSDLLGLYDPVDGVVWAANGRLRRRALLHGIVQALEDHSFDLRHRLAGKPRDRDAALAAAAIVEGEAQVSAPLPTRTFLVAAPRRTAAADAPPIDRFLALERESADAAGAALVRLLRYLGGNRAVASALREFPTTTTQLLHVDAFLMRERAVPPTLPPSTAGFALRGSDTFGELDVRSLLSTFEVAGAAAAADGWAGGRSGIYADATGRSAVVVALAWESADDAQQWAAAAASYVARAFGANSAPAACGAGATCWSASGRTIASAADGSQTALAIGPDAASASALAAAALAPADS